MRRPRFAARIHEARSTATSPRTRSTETFQRSRRSRGTIHKLSALIKNAGHRREPLTTHVQIGSTVTISRTTAKKLMIVGPAGRAAQGDLEQSPVGRELLGRRGRHGRDRPRRRHQHKIAGPPGAAPERPAAQARPGQAWADEIARSVRGRQVTTTQDASGTVHVGLCAAWCCTTPSVAPWPARAGGPNSGTASRISTRWTRPLPPDAIERTWACRCLTCRRRRQPAPNHARHFATLFPDTCRARHPPTSLLTSELTDLAPWIRTSRRR